MAFFYHAEEVETIVIISSIVFNTLSQLSLLMIINSLSLQVENFAHLQQQGNYSKVESYYTVSETSIQQDDASQEDDDGVDFMMVAVAQESLLQHSASFKER